LWVALRRAGLTEDLLLPENPYGGQRQNQGSARERTQ
jgi:hypothetical protein